LNLSNLICFDCVFVLLRVLVDNFDIDVGTFELFGGPLEQTFQTQSASPTCPSRVENMQDLPIRSELRFLECRDCCNWRVLLY